MKAIDADGCCGPEPARGRPLRGGRRARLVAVLRALADPTRVEILRLAAGRPEPVCVCEITERFRWTQPTISYHLRILRAAGLVEATRKGVWVHYEVLPAGLAVLREFLAGFPVRRQAEAVR
jgi:ArsR family transcriptional regulator